MVAMAMVKVAGRVASVHLQHLLLLREAIVRCNALLAFWEAQARVVELA